MGGDQLGPGGAEAQARDESDRLAPSPPSGASGVFGERLDVAMHYGDLLADTGVSHGLIGPREVERLWERHILNCAVVATLLPDNATVVDVGSGAGLPGLAMAIARPDVSMQLVEPMARRVSWLEDAVATLGLTNTTVHRGRADEVQVRGTVVTARAVSKLSTLAGWMACVADEDALMLALKGASAAAELERDRAAAQRSGWVDLWVDTVGGGLVEQPATVIRGRYRPGPRRRDRRSA